MKLTIWNLGMEILKEQGTPEPQARSLIGKLIKDHGEPKVMLSIGQLSVKNPAEAKSYLIGLCKRESIPDVTDEQGLVAYAKKHNIKWNKAKSYYQLRQWCLDAS